MTSILSTPGKYRNRKDISAGSIPKLVALEEESNGTTVLTLNSNGIVMINSKDTANGVNGVNDNSTPVKPPRRSSIGILGGRNANTNAQDGKTNKRRSSIATFLGGRRESKTSHNHTINTIHEKYSKNSESDDENETPNDQNGQIKDNGYAIDDGYDKKRRRSSWQAKLERRRRKGMTSALDTETRLQYSGASISGIKYEREKRHSWWNIFVPENLKQRTRRASQDAILSQNSDNLTPYRRSKSRSVDHGLAAPFDLDSLRSKVEGRFESIDRLSKDGEKKRSLTTIPTASYTVGDRDTLTSVAARFDTTPSELSHLNRLNSSFIYSGQVILVPDKSSRESGSEIGDGESSERSSNSPTAGHRQHESHEDLTLDEKNLLEGLRPVSPKPGHIECVSSPNNQSGGGGGTSAGDAGGTNEDDPVIIQRFLKINVRHITDGQGVVGGVLLVTPNAVMFDPNVSDPLVIEHGPECYGVIAPMEFIVNAAIFNDIAHMRVNGATGNNTTEKAEVYHPPSKACSRSDTHSPGKDSLLVKDETFPELGIEVAGEVCDDQESIASSNEREGAAFPKAFDRDLVTPNNMQQRLQGGDSLESAASFDKPSSPYMSCETPNSLDGGVPDSKAKDKSEKATTKTDDHSTDNKTNNTLNSDSKTLEERRRSLLDHHWAIPSKDSSMDEKEAEEMAEKSMPVAEEAVAAIEDGGYLVKLECHDSGIDIRDPVIPVVQPTHAKKIYSDADIVLSSEWVPPLTIPSHIHGSEGSPKSTFLSSSLAMGTSTTESSQRKKNSSVSFSVEEHEPTQVTVEKGGENKKNKMLKRLSYPLAWVEGLTGESSGKSDSMDSAPNTGDSNQSVFSKVFSRRSSIGTFIRPHSSSSESGGPQSSSSSGVKKSAPKLDYRSMVSIDDMPTLFVSFDKLIPRPARACPDPPMYLRLRMGKPIGKTTPLPTTVMSYGKNKLRPEYWFSIPKNKVDELYRFLNAWVQHIYGELDEEAIAARGYDLIQCDTEFLNKSGSPNKDGRSASEGEITEYTRESWEVLSMSTDDYRKAALFTAGSFDQDFQIPELIGQTEILSEEHREKLCAHLPARAEGYSWTLVFSTSLHGFSLNSLYRKMHKLESPVLIVIEDTEHNVFGALTSCALHVSDLFYGTGESLLYKFNPTFKVFHWTGENLYFIKGNPESLAIGAGDGKFGLWLDGDLNQGRSQSCSTYSNEPLAPQEDFVIKTLECWAFV